MRGPGFTLVQRHQQSCRLPLSPVNATNDRRGTRMSHPFTIAASSSGIARMFAVALVFVAGLAGNNIKASAVEMSPAAKAVVDYDKAFTTPTKKYRIAYLTECVDNPYCLARLEGLKAAAKKYGFDFKIFDANFSPATQAKVVENAVTEGFEGYLFTYWENAIKKAAAKYPNVKVVVDEPANFDPRIALKKIQDALLAHPHINIVISSWDDMSRGVEQAVVAAGKTPGKDISIFSGGATKVGVEKVKSGKWASTMAYLPYQEAYYGAAALMMALDGKPINAYIDAELLPEIVNSTGTVFINKDNVDKYKPVYCAG